MTDYMFMILGDESATARATPAELKTLIEGHTAYAKSLRAKDAYRDGSGLRPSAEGKRVHVRDGETLVTNGPFDGKTLGGFYQVSAPSLEAAVALAKECPTLPGESVDVRPLMKGKPRDTKSGAGKVFAFGVIGNAPNEKAWSKVMDTIDHDTHDEFPESMFLGGVRLEAPSSGRLITKQGGAPVVLDGPFLESKEVIGGVFFMRMASIEDAVKWAAGTAFVRIGGVEIRELWQS